MRTQYHVVLPAQVLVIFPDDSVNGRSPTMSQDGMQMSDPSYIMEMVTTHEYRSGAEILEAYMTTGLVSVYLYV